MSDERVGRQRREESSDFSDIVDRREVGVYGVHGIETHLIEVACPAFTARSELDRGGWSSWPRAVAPNKCALRTRIAVSFRKGDLHRTQSHVERNAFGLRADAHKNAFIVLVLRTPDTAAHRDTRCGGRIHSREILELLEEIHSA